MHLDENSSDSIYELSLRRFRFLMRLTGIMQFEWNHWHNHRNLSKICLFLWKMLFTFAILALINFITQLRSRYIVFAEADALTLHINYIGYYSLVAVHVVMLLESIWKSRYYRLIFAHFDRVRELYAEKLTIPFNCGIIKFSTFLLYGFFGIYVLVMSLINLLLDTMASNLSLYSDLMIHMKWLEFCLFAAIVMALLQQLCTVGMAYVHELHVSRFDVAEVRKSSLARIFVLQDIHAELWDGVHCIEEYFEWTVASLMLKMFLDVIMISYWIYQSFDCNVSYKNTICGCCYLTLQVLMLSLACGICNFCEVLHKRFRCLFQNISTDRRNIYLASCLREMDLQLMHEAIYFSAGGFADVNTRTLGSGIFTAITFVVILIQFRMAF